MSPIPRPETAGGESEHKFETDSSRSAPELFKEEEERRNVGKGRRGKEHRRDHSSVTQNTPICAYQVITSATFKSEHCAGK